MAVNSISWKMPSKFSFYSAKSKRKIRVKPYLIEFKRLLESSITAVAGVSGFSSTIFLLKTIRVFVTKALGCCLHVNFWLLQVSNQELLHAIVALYDNCLPEITPEVLYPTVCGKWAKTLVLLRDFQGVELCPQLPVHVTVILPLSSSKSWFSLLIAIHIVQCLLWEFNEWYLKTFWVL